MEKLFYKKNIAKTLLLIFYAIFTFVVLLHHEIWADEAQAWLVARDLNIFELFAHLQSEGHPIFWYLLIMPFAKLLHFSNAIFSMQVLNWFIMLTGAGFLLFKSPFNLPVKTSVLLSSGFLFWYPVNARNYCLIPILLFLTAVLYEKRKKHPFLYAGIIILLANTHVIMFGVCSALAFMFLFEAIKEKDRKRLYSCCAILAVLFGMILYFWGAQDANFIVQNSYPHSPGIAGFFETYKKVVLNIFGFSNFLNIFLFTLFLLFCAFVFYTKDKKIFFVFLFNFAFQMGIYMYVWMIHPPRAYLLLLVPLFCFWCVYSKTENKKLKIAANIFLILMFLITVPDGLKLAKLDYLYEFSGGQKAAEYIKNNIPQDAFIVSNFPLSTTAVSAYLPKDRWKIYYDGYKNFYTYTIWNKPIAHPSEPIPLFEMLKQHKTVYAILSTGAFYTDIQPVYESNKTVLRDQEKFRIYKIERK